ncbi:E3 ubiquitin-protein ligase AMFR [Galendromus occidentalis]|uniref:E3 ubiquitin-protein ligase AMFR n=1 Tax=Galendromus occidentalis TaxID=34638 RepID=A0AAJ6QUN6_9ACAR|nr:E3 ubiquitin-protein ligase AMFR [Galendromus occidentalis]
MLAVWNVLSTIFYGVLTLLSLPTFWCVMFVLLFETFISMCDVLLKLLGCLLQQMVFGELRLHDDSLGKDRLWNFVFYKFIFVFGVLNVSQAEAIVSWGAWFSLLGFLHLLTQLCQDRFDYISVPTQLPRGTHVRIVALLLGLLTACGFLHVAAYNHARNKGFNYFLLVDAEVFLISVKVAYAFVRYGVHMWETFAERTASDRRAEVSYYLELGLQLSILGVEFLHDLHMVIWGNVFLSMASVVISMRLHSTFTELKRRIGKHQHYARISQLLVGRYPSATADQLDDPCAICWENMHSARVLPCRHLFHETCLRSWLEQDISCPTCRLHLDIEKKHPKLEAANPDVDDDAPNVPGTSQHVFHFDGSRFISWLPTVSVELSTSPVVLEEFQRTE